MASPASVNIYRRGDITVVSPLTVIRKGDLADASQPNGTLLELREPYEGALLGRTVLEGLARSGDPLPSELKTWERDLHGLLRVRSRRQLMREAQMVKVEAAGSEVKVEAWPRDPRGGGWGPDSSKPPFQLQDPPPEDLGNTVDRAFAMLDDA